MQKLVDALLGQRKQKTYQIGNTKVVLQTLTAGEQAEVSRIVGSRELIYSSQIEAVKLPTLSRSLVLVNDIAIDTYPEVREKLRNDPMLSPIQAIELVLSEYDGGMINHLVGNCYSDLIDERAREIDSLKNSSGDQSAELSGKSAPSSAPLPVA